jgi:transcriptional regulator with XRE-family HTH domain
LKKILLANDVCVESLKNFGTALRNMRQEKGLSQEALASRLDMVSNGYISRLESGQKNPTLEMVFKLAEALEIKAWELIKLVEEKEQN